MAGDPGRTGSASGRGAATGGNPSSLGRERMGGKQKFSLGLGSTRRLCELALCTLPASALAVVWPACVEEREICRAQVALPAFPQQNLKSTL
jgi:hypothetical protein